MPGWPASVLYVCARNRVRSPMAEALTHKLYGEAVQAESSGLQPAEAVDPMTEMVMQEVGVDLSDHRPRLLNDIDITGSDLIVALSPEAWTEVQRAAGDGREIEYWPVSDPTLVEGSRDQALEAYRQTRRELETRIVERFGPPPEWE